MAAERTLPGSVQDLAAERGLRITFDRMARSRPVEFDPCIIEMIEAVGRKRGHATARMVSGAGHDAQMMALIAPAAMIFVPSPGGLRHCPEEHTAPEHVAAGANVLLDVVTELILDEAAALT